MLELKPFRLGSEYLKEWNETHGNFFVLTKNGKRINDSIYRPGSPEGLTNENYFRILKYVESFYDIEFLKEYYPNTKEEDLESKKKHLSGKWCILSKDGVEKKVFDNFKTPYIVKNSCIYSVNGSYYNIETGEFYCSDSKSMESSEFLFLENPYDKDVSRRGVMKINKKNGTWELFS